jgi:hypothetical protein
MTTLKKLKRRGCLISSLALFGIASVSGQSLPVKTGNQNTGMNKLVSAKEYLDVIYVGKHKNTYLQIKNFRVKSIDLGGGPGQVLFTVDQNGLVKLRALKTNFAETNMLVTTSDRLFQFLVKYSENQKTLYTYAPDATTKAILKPTNAALSPTASNGTLKGTATPLGFERAYMVKANIHGVKDENDDLRLDMKNLLQDKQFFYWVFQIHNKSSIEYPIDYLGFEVRNKGKETKNKTIQSFYPGYRGDPRNSTVIPAGQEKLVCYATEKFALRGDEEMYISLFERSNNSKGRQYKVKVSAKQFKKVGRI